MILVTGATGNVGGELVRSLASSGEEVRALSRGVARAVLPQGVNGVVGDLDRPETLRGALDGVRAAFLLPGYRDMPRVLAEIRRAGDLVRAPFAGVRVAAIDPFDIAAVAAEGLCSAGHEGRTYTLLGPESFGSGVAPVRRSGPCAGRDAGKGPETRGAIGRRGQGGDG